MTLHDDDGDDDYFGNSSDSGDYRDGNNEVDGYDDNNDGSNNFKLVIMLMLTMTSLW